MADPAVAALATVTTARLVLRRVDEQHRPLMHQMDSDVAVVGLDGVWSADQSDAFVANQIEHWQRHGSARGSLPRIVAVAQPTNAASRRVLDKIGFAYVGDVLYEGTPHVLDERRRPNQS